MATYSHGYKKQSAEQTLLQIIVGIIVAVFVIVGIAFGFNKLSEWKSYNHYSQLTAYGDILSNTDAGDNYVVYLYNSNGNICADCATIKNDVLRVGNKIQKNTGNFYIADISAFSTSDTAGKTQFLADTNQIEVLTPSLIVVKGGQFYEIYAGQADVLSTLNSIADDTFTPFN